MALIVETGTGSSTANAFWDAASIGTYHTSHGNAAWIGADTLKEAAIIRATAFLSNSYQWQGYKRNGRPQALAWPRVDVVDCEGWGVAFDEVPIEIKYATAEIALRELITPGSMNPDFTASEQVKREKVGELEVEYLNSNTSAEGARPVLLIVRDLIGGLLRKGAGNALVGQASRA
ncbi:DnaT-like ssDNA-binding protein [Phyllobacterium sp. P5_D12]